jgi:hypothetical protein
MRPLSEYLSAAKIGPNDIGHQVVYEGEETVDGLPCVRIRSEQFYAAGQPPDVTLLWLAVERNYLPVKLVGYVVSYSTDIPLVVSTVSDLRELAPGVWFPFAQTRIKNDEIAASKGQTLVVTRTDNTVTKAVLGPQYDLSLFREISIPDGMPVIEIKEGEKLRDYLQGNAPPPAARWSWWWLVVCLVAAVVLGVLWKRRTTAVQRAFHP